MNHYFFPGVTSHLVAFTIIHNEKENGEKDPHFYSITGRILFSINEMLVNVDVGLISYLYLSDTVVQYGY